MLPSTSTRTSPVATYDSVRACLVVFSGYRSGTALNDVEGLSFGATPTWAPIAPSGALPGPRAGACAISDLPRDRMIVFAGATTVNHSTVWYNDVWEFQWTGEPTWTRLFPTGTLPAGRENAAAVYDSRRERMIVFGGSTSSGYKNDVWVLTLAAGTPAWTQVTVAGTPPTARSGAVAIYDRARDRVVLFGGFDASFNRRNDVWALSLAGTPTWSPLTPAGSVPEARHTASAIYDVVRDRMILYAGFGESPFYYKDDVWELAFSPSLAWSQLAPAGAIPPGRNNHVAVYDGARDRMLVYGGSGSAGQLGDAWELVWGTALDVADTAEPEALLAWSAPNPAPHDPIIEFRLPAAGPAAVTIYDAAGRRIRTLANGWFLAGTHSARWDRTTDRGDRARAGIYFYEVRARGPHIVQKLILLN